MAFTEMSLPVDIPWKRMAVSKDMIDPQGGDLCFPQQWNSSIAVFYHEPTELPPEYCGRKITYLKVVCTLSNYQLQGTELGEWYNVLDELRQSAWLENYHAFTGWIEDSLFWLRSFPCYGALLQIGVYPTITHGVVELQDYPYIASFEPQKREMYEAVTESGELLSQSSNRVNVGKQMTNTLSGEKYDLDTGSSSSWGTSASHGDSGSAAFGLGQWSGENSVSNQGSVSDTGQWGTVARNNQEDQQVTSIDASREKRESVSHSTSLNNIYSLLQGFHLGTNRVLFAMQPRPHIQDAKFSFVQGPRRLEGIQEFFLIVNRPASVPGFCVEATLETGHLNTTKTYKPRLIPLSELYSPGNLNKTAEALGLDTTLIDSYPFYRDLMIRWNQSMPHVRVLVQQYIQDPKSVSFSEYGVSYANTAIFLMYVLAQVPGIGIEDVAIIFEEYEQDFGSLFLTGRYVRACAIPQTNSEGAAVDQENSAANNISSEKTGSFIVFEKQYSGPAHAGLDTTQSKKGNALIQGIQQAMLESMGSPDRVPVGELGFLETEFAMEKMEQLLSFLAEAGAQDKPLQDITGIRPLIEKGLGKHSGIKQVLEVRRLSTPDIAKDMQVSKIEAKKIRSRLLREAIKSLDAKSLKPKARLKNPIQAVFAKNYPIETLHRLVESAYQGGGKAVAPSTGKVISKKPVAIKKSAQKK